jgi:hypothetical protein
MKKNVSLSLSHPVLNQPKQVIQLNNVNDKNCYTDNSFFFILIRKQNNIKCFGKIIKNCISCRKREIEKINKITKYKIKFRKKKNIKREE